MQCVWNAYYSGASVCPLKIEMAQFRNGFSLNSDFVYRAKYWVKEGEGTALGESVDQYKIPWNSTPTPPVMQCQH